MYTQGATTEFTAHGQTMTMDADAHAHLMHEAFFEHGICSTMPEFVALAQSHGAQFKDANIPPTP